MHSHQPSPSSRLQVSRPAILSPLFDFFISQSSISVELDFSITDKSLGCPSRAVHAWDSHCPRVSGCEPWRHGRCSGGRNPAWPHRARSHRRSQRPAGEQPEPSGQYALELNRSWRAFRCTVKQRSGLIKDGPDVWAWSVSTFIAR